MRKTDKWRFQISRDGEDIEYMYGYGPVEFLKLVCKVAGVSSGYFVINEESLTVVLGGSVVIVVLRDPIDDPERWIGGVI